MVALVLPAGTACKIKALYSKDYENHLRLLGAKLNLDGGSPGRTAFLREPYFTQASGQSADYRGYSSIPDQDYLNSLVADYYKAEIPAFIHALGDAAVDQCIEAVRYAEEKTGNTQARTQLIHLQQVQADQFESMKALDVTLTFQITHNFYFSDFHNEYIYGPERTARLNPTRDALNHGFSTTIHHDSPVHPVSQIELIWMAVNRSSRSGKVYGADQKMTPYEALYASTHAAAYQYQEEDIKGSLKVGKLADFVVLDQNPLKVSPSDIKSIRIEKTIKEGKTVYSKNKSDILNEK